MDINVHVFFKMLNKRKEQKQFESRPVGSAIKYQRKRMNMTLEEGSAGICSISYLSKLENNQISCNPDFLERLLDRFQLTDRYEESDPSYLEHLDRLVDHIIFHEPIDVEIYEKYLGHQDHQSMLIQLCIHHIQKDEFKFKSIYRDVTGFIPHMSDHELAVLSIIFTEVLYAEGKYRDGHDILMLTRQLKDLKHHVKLSRTKWRLLHAFKMHNTSEIHTLYPRFVEQATQTECYELQREIQRHLIAYHAEHQHPQTMTNQLSSIKKIDKKDYDYLLAMSYHYHQHYDKVIRLMRPYATTNTDALNLCAMAMDQLNQKDGLLKLIDQTKTLKMPVPTKGLIDHLFKKYTMDKEQLLQHLRMTLLSHKGLPHDYQILEYLMIDGQQLFAKFQFYKEANQVVTHIRPQLNLLKKSPLKETDEA